MKEKLKINRLILVAISLVIVIAFLWRLQIMHQNMNVTISETARTSTIGLHIEESESNQLNKVSESSAKEGHPLTIDMINEMDLDELIKIKGIGEVTGQKIIDYRQANGPFQSFEALIEIKGIGEKKLEQIKNARIGDEN